MRPLYTVAWPEAGQWVASCIDYDIGAQGPDRETVLKRLDQTIQLDRIESRLRTGVEFGGVGPAPQNVIDLWNEARAPLVAAELRERAAMWEMG